MSDEISESEIFIFNHGNSVATVLEEMNKRIRNCD